jgi:hypothetical protein
MRSFWAYRSYQTRIHPALTSFADECCGTLARLLAYVGALALPAILGIHLWDELPVGEAIEPSAKPGWGVASRSHPAFAVSQFNLPEKTETYEILRHPQSADFGLVVPGRRLSGPARRDRLCPEPVYAADGRK